ncbi:unnamed protein product, partial [Effrenium voratum]
MEGAPRTVSSWREPQENPDRFLRRWFVRFLQRLAGRPTPAGSEAPEPQPVSAARASWRIWRRLSWQEDPLQNVGSLLHQALIDLALTKEQQEVFERVVACNKHFWEVAVDGVYDGSPPWRRHVAFNMALLRVLHRHQAAQRVVEAITQEVEPTLSRGEAQEALRYCRWTLAAYGGRGERDGSETFDERSRQDRSLPTSSPSCEEERVHLAAAICGLSAESILVSDLDNAKQCVDPLCPRFLLAMDSARCELILSIRGTMSLSDLFADLIGDTEPFAGGQAHAGILHSSRRLLDRVYPHLKQGFHQLQEAGGSPRLVLVGHSLGAGVCELLAVLLLGGAKAGEVPYTLPEDVPLRCFLFAPPPVFGVQTEERASHFAKAWGKLGSFTFRKSSADAVDKAREASLAFALNFDIIPRTSLHNGYKLFQEARLVDDTVDWGQSEVLRRLREPKVSLAQELLEKLSAEARKRPAPGNPFAAQHAVAERVVHVNLVPGGTAAFSRCTSCSEPSAILSARERGGWLQKRSDHLRQWRRRFAWIEEGELRFAPGPEDPVKTRVPLTADSTRVTLLGEPSAEPLPPGMNSMMSFRAEQKEVEAPGEVKVPKNFPTPWALRVQTNPSWSGVEQSEGLSEIATCEAADVAICADTAAERDAWLQELAAAVRSARRCCMRATVMAPENFGREALLGEGLLADHDAGRYEVALETIIDQLTVAETESARASTD